MKVRTMLAILILALAGVANAQESGVAWDQLSEQQQRVLSGWRVCRGAQIVGPT